MAKERHIWRLRIEYHKTDPPDTLTPAPLFSEIREYQGITHDEVLDKAEFIAAHGFWATYPYLVLPRHIVSIKMIT